MLILMFEKFSDHKCHAAAAAAAASDDDSDAGDVAMADYDVAGDDC